MGPGPKIKTEFEKTCECVVTFVGLDSSFGILGRLQLEGAASKADIALTKRIFVYFKVIELF